MRMPSDRLGRDATDTNAMNPDDDNGQRPRAHARSRWRLERIDWRVVGVVALIGALDKPDWLDSLPDAQWGPALRALARTELTGFLVLVVSATLIRWRRPTPPRPVALAIGVVASCLISFALTHRNDAAHYIGGPLGGDASAWTVVWFFARRSMLLWGMLAAAWYFMQRSAERRAALQESEFARRRLEAQVAAAQLKRLEAQVEPHFLFNTLAHVRHAYETDPVLAGRMLESFCDYLHTALPNMRDATATLASELALAEAYLAIQKIRMGDRLDVHFTVADEDRLRPFPPMMLASLVENAIKHGLNPLPEGGTVRVSARSIGDVLRVVVADTGRGFSVSRGTGIGLANIRGRLAAVYGTAARITLVPNAPRGICAIIEIPIAAAASTAEAFG